MISLILAACEAGGQTPYEQAGDPAPFETSVPAANTSASSAATASKAASPAKPAAKSGVVTTYETEDSTLNAPEPSSSPSSDPIVVNAVPAVAAKPPAPKSPDLVAGDQYLLAPADTTGGAAINYQQTDNTSAPIVVMFASNDPSRIEVIVRDDLPVKGAVLSDPQRRHYLAAGLVHKTVAYQPQAAAQSDVGLNVLGDPKTIISGVGLGIPLNPGGSTSGGLLNESRFSFVIPDRAAYDESWRKWVIHIDLDDGMTTRSMELLPPQPKRG